MSPNIFANIKEKDKSTLEGENSVDGRQVKRLSIDCKATVNIGDYSRGGKTRGDARAADHDMGCEEKYGSIWHRRRGRRGAISDLWKLLQDQRFHRRQLDGLVGEHPCAGTGGYCAYPDQGRQWPGEQWCAYAVPKRIVEFVDYTRTIVQLLYYPPYHSKYNPIERC